MNIGETGKNGEDKVAAFLRKQGYFVLMRNFICKEGEIDIIAEDDEYIIFVEVKTRKAGSLSSGREAVDCFKQQRCIAAARKFVSHTRCEKPMRFDVAEVTVTQKDGKKSYSLNYIKNAF